MMNDNERRIKAQAAIDNGGILAEENEENIRLHLAIDPKNPMAIFDQLNEFEIELVRRAGNDIKKVEEASSFVDDIRIRTKALLKSVGINIAD